MVLNTSFYSGYIAAARTANAHGDYKELGPYFFKSIQALEEEAEPWSRYQQLTHLLDSEISRATEGDYEADDYDDY